MDLVELLKIEIIIELWFVKISKKIIILMFLNKMRVKN